jgi:DNA-binding NtrC family response regulator
VKFERLKTKVLLVEYKLILDALWKFNQRKDLASTWLGITRQTLHNKLKAGEELVNELSKRNVKVNL